MINLPWAVGVIAASPLVPLWLCFPGWYLWRKCHMMCRSSSSLETESSITLISVTTWSVCARSAAQEEISEKRWFIYYYHSFFKNWKTQNWPTQCHNLSSGIRERTRFCVLRLKPLSSERWKFFFFKACTLTVPPTRCNVCYISHRTGWNKHSGHLGHTIFHYNMPQK